MSERGFISGKAVEYFERGCKLGSMNGCSNLGVALQRGDGVAKDEKRAAELFTRACNKGHKASCALLEAD